MSTAQIQPKESKTEPKSSFQCEIKRKSAAITNNYLSYTLPNGSRLRLPLLHIRLAHGGVGFKTIGLADSGSTTTFIPADLVEIFGLKLEEGVETTGAGGKFPTSKSIIDRIQLLKGNTPYAEFKNWPILIPKPEQAIPYVVLGRDSLFKYFDVTFRERDKNVILRQS